MTVTAPRTQPAVLLNLGATDGAIVRGNVTGGTDTISGNSIKI